LDIFFSDRPGDDFIDSFGGYMGHKISVYLS